MPDLNLGCFLLLKKQSNMRDMCYHKTMDLSFEGELQMKISEVIAYLNEHHNSMNKKIYEIYHFSECFGVKVTDLRTLAKKIGYNDQLSDELLNINAFETIFLSALVQNPKTVTYDKIQKLAILAKGSSIVDQALSDLVMQSKEKEQCLKTWFNHENIYLRYAFYATYQAYLRKNLLDEMNQTFGVAVLDQIMISIKDEEPMIQNAMNNVVVMAGLHVPNLVDKAYEAARHIGYVLPLRAKNSCNIQSALDYLDRYITQPKYSRVAKLQQEKQGK